MRRARRFFGLVAPLFPLVDRMLLPRYRRLLAELELDPSLDVLDVGTGTGTLAVAFAERGHRVAGIDVSPRLLRTARRRLPGVHLRTMDLADLPRHVADGAFGIVACAYVLHGLPENLRRLALCEGARIGRSWLLVVDYPCRPGSWPVRVVERIEGPHYASWIARPFHELVAGIGLEVAASGEVAGGTAWWLVRTGDPGPGRPNPGNATRP